MASRAKIVQKWLADRIGLAIILVAAAVVVGLMGRITYIKAASTPGNLIFSEYGHYELKTWAGRDWTGAVVAPPAINVALTGDSVRFAIIGYQSEGLVPESSILPTFNISRGGTVVGSAPARTSKVAATGTGRVAIMQYADITDILNANHGGSYQIANGPSAAWNISFIFVIERDDTYFPLTNIAISDFIYARQGTVRPPDVVVNLAIPPVPEGYHYAQNGVGTIRMLGGWFDSQDSGGAGNDFSTATYTMGEASGPIFNSDGTARPGSFWPTIGLGGWGRARIPVFDRTATQFTLRIVNTSFSSGSGEAGSWLIFDSPLARDIPEPPMVVTDTCYKDEE